MDTSEYSVPRRLYDEYYMAATLCECCVQYSSEELSVIIAGGESEAS